MDISSLAKTLGRRGGLSRSRRLSAERKKQIAALGGKSRAQSLVLARCILVNFCYLETIRVLRGETITVKREKNFTGKLPRLYAKK